MIYAFLGSGRCFHTEDWYNSAKVLESIDNLNINKILFITDQLDGEGFKTFLTKNDNLVHLFLIDFLLFKKFSLIGSIWRNILKILFIPYQIFLLKKILSEINDDVIIHAHSTYYSFLASFCNCFYISTPQGSEVLVRPRSIFYRMFAKRAHSKAALITVDSTSMKEKLLFYFNLHASVYQNGISVEKFKNCNFVKSNNLLSIRGCFPNYRLHEILKERNNTENQQIDFCFPFFDPIYLSQLQNLLQKHDYLHGKLSRDSYHDLLMSTSIRIRIPESDSSPRSVYEAIFANCIAIVAKHQYIYDLPICMRSRLVVVESFSSGWLSKALREARLLVNSNFQPSEEALNLYSQTKSMERIMLHSTALFRERFLK